MNAQIKKTLFSIIIIIAVISFASDFIPTSNSPPQTMSPAYIKEGQAHYRDQFYILMDKATVAYPELIPSEAYNELSRQNLKKASQREEIYQMTALHFHNYYMAQIIGLSSICSTKGVSIKNYTDAYTEAHNLELRALKKIMEKYKTDLSEMNLFMKGAWAALAEQKIYDISTVTYKHSGVKISLTEVCEFLNLDFKDYVELEHFKSNFPNSSNILRHANQNL